MKKTIIFLSAVALSVVTSCTKEEIKPSINPTNNTKSLVISESAKAPLIIAGSVSCLLDRSGVSKFNVVFNQTTANFYGSSLYLRYKTHSSSIWSSAIQMTTFTNPNGVYKLNFPLQSNLLLDVQFMDTPSATSTSQIYLVTTP